MTMQKLWEEHEYRETIVQEWGFGGLSDLEVFLYQAFDSPPTGYAVEEIEPRVGVEVVETTRFSECFNSTRGLTTVTCRVVYRKIAPGV